VNKFNPLCPEKGCKRVMVIKEFTQYAGINEITGKKKWGLSKYWVCPVHKHQRFKVGAEVILRKPIPIIEPKKDEKSDNAEKAKSKSQRRRFLIPRKIRRKIIREQSKRKEE
jgi:hypothetical protein